MVFWASQAKPPDQDPGATQPAAWLKELKGGCSAVWKSDGSWGNHGPFGIVIEWYMYTGGNTAVALDYCSSHITIQNLEFIITGGCGMRYDIQLLHLLLPWWFHLPICVVVAILKLPKASRPTALVCMNKLPQLAG